ncbi:MAG: ATP-binding cassette domain-containing protein, partial [Deltaproteobacteria bacterium]|nr:ATP-binding cassette domain-containing protein [Deltaproteobacteria bacterium]
MLTTEHNLLVIQNANHIIELGPEGGSKGGRVIFQGSPEALRSAGTPTARALTEKTKFKTQVFARVKYQNVLEVLDCRQRNLKIDHLKIPYNKLVVFTGPSGAGKSSLVFETIAGEAQRLFLNNLSPYTLSFLDILPKPTVGVLKNLKPAIFLEQYYAIPSEFSSLGTLTDTLSYLRLLYAKRGTQYCPKHKKPLVKIEMEDLIREIQRENGHRLICGTLVSGRKGLFKDLLQMIYKSEAEGALIDGIFFPRTRLYFAKLDKNKQHYIDVVVGSFDPSKTSKALIEEAVRFANKFNAKIIKVFNPSTRASILYSLEKACPVCNIATRNLDPEDFSFSSKRGRCNECGGYGVVDNKTCSACCGTGINETALNVLFYGKNIGELSSMRVADLYSFFLKANRVDQVTRSILDEILPKLKSLIDLGLGYLSLDRRLSTLSSGELQRARLASVLNTPLRDVLIVLDEPTASLHPLDVELVIKKIKEQVKNGNSIFMVEHDIQAIMESDHVIELGPGGGEEGGHVVFEGPIKNFPRCGSKTAIAVEQRKNVYYSAKKIPSSYIFVKSSKVNNLRVENLKIPTECLVVICGRSGSGKTSLALKTIFEGFYNPKSKLYDVKFPSNIEEAVYVDQTLISKNSRATPATFLKIFDEIRRIFSLLPQAKALGLSPSSFSFNSKKWVCEVCKGSGLVTHELGFLRHEIVRCQACQGKRYKNELLSIKFKGYSIAEVLELTFKEAGKVFLEFRNVARLINEVIEIGLGYLKLGQPLSSLSGGENQRLKLVKNLVSGQRRKLLFVLDEPTLGPVSY